MHEAVSSTFGFLNEERKVPASTVRAVVREVGYGDVPVRGYVTVPTPHAFSLKLAVCYASRHDPHVAAIKAAPDDKKRSRGSPVRCV